MKDNKYFAAADKEECVSECLTFVTSRHTNSDINHIWRKNSQIYYQNVISDPLEFTGRRGEMVSMSVPKARKLLRDYLSIVTKQKLKFKTLMKTHEYSNWVDSKIVDALAQEVIDKQNISSKRDKLGENVFLLGQSFLWVTWNSESGRKIMNQETGLPKFSGCAEVKVMHPNKVHYDHTAGNQWDDVNWVIIEDQANKYDLATLHPEFKDSLESAGNTYNYDYETVFQENVRRQEMITVYHFYHKATPAVPDGRMVIFTDANTILYDGVNPYERIPVFECIPETIDDMALGYPQFSNLTAIQEMLDHNYSVIASNQSVWGVQTMLNPRGSDLDVRQVFGLNLADYTPSGPDGGGKPEPMQYPATPGEVFEMVERYSNTIDSIGGINSALRGQAPQGVTAASAIATLTANALEFISSFSSALHTTVTDAVSFSCKLYYIFGAEEQYIDLVDGSISTQKQFTNKSLSNFDKLTIELTNPLLNSYSFNMQSAQDLLSKGLIKDPKTYFRVLEGDKTSIMYDGDLQEEMLIQQENDDLMQGIPCQVIIDDDHPLHKLHHKTLLMNPKARREMDPQTLQVIMDHMAQHTQFEMQMMQSPAGPQGALPPGNAAPPPAQQGPSNVAQPAQPAEAPVSL